jgi:phage FluMu protein Com
MLKKSREQELGNKVCKLINNIYYKSEMTSYKTNFNRGFDAIKEY